MLLRPISRFNIATVMVVLGLFSNQFHASSEAATLQNSKPAPPSIADWVKSNITANPILNTTQNGIQ